MSMSTSASCSSGSDSLVFIKRRHGTILLRAGHQYHVKKKYKSGLVVWECTQRRQKCRGVLKILNENVEHETAHSCTPDFLKNEVEERVYACKQTITDGNYPPVPQAFNNMVAKFENSGLDLLCKLPKYTSIKSSLYRYRNAKAGVKVLRPKEVEKVEVPTKFEKFLLADFDDKIRILVFCSEQAKKYMCEVTDFYSDGTFKSCPKPFSQLYVIAGDLGSTMGSSNVVPLIYALMSAKTMESYYRLFDMIKLEIPGWTPRKYKCDYEKAVMQAIKKCFPCVEITGCYYHYNKAIWEKGRKLGITKSKDVKKIREVSRTAVLPLLPSQEIPNGWKWITRHSTQEEDMLKFRNYVEKQWLKEEFISTWCVFAEKHRTNNSLEAWNHKLNQEVGKKNPNIIHLLEVLVRDADYNSVCNKINKQLTLMKKRQKKYVLTDEFILETQLDLLHGNITVGHFLEILRH